MCRRSRSLQRFNAQVCPVCNKLFLLALGPALLMQYFEPIRLYVGLAGVALLAFALWRRVRAGARPGSERTTQAPADRPDRDDRQPQTAR